MSKAPKPEDPVVGDRMFADIPKIIRKKGRVAGFEALRDRSLGNWEEISSKMNPYSAVKLALEADRHAMFAEVAAERSKGKFDQTLWEQFQGYLHGEVDQGKEVPDPAPIASEASGSSSDSNEEEEDAEAE